MIAEDVPNVPTASLYRHINKLVEDNIIEVCEENKIRGTVEKVYQLKGNPFQEIEEIGVKNNKDSHYNLFYGYAMSLLNDFNHYLSVPDYDMLKDKVGFHSYPVYLSDDECDEFYKLISEGLMKIINNRPEVGRKLRKISIISMPVEEGKGLKE
jgi:hypothetical protein